MLHYLDVMIGFVFTMLVLSLAVTAVVQAVPVYLGNLKGISLQNGLIDLLMRISHDSAAGQKIDADIEALIGTILRDPLLSPRRAGLVVWIRNAVHWVWTRLDASHVKPPIARARAAVMYREEFVRLLLDFASKDGPETGPDLLGNAREKARALIGVKDAKGAQALLVAVRNRVAELELQHPDWSSSKRADQAMLEKLLFSNAKDFLAKLVGWYDQTIDRVEAAFTARVRNWTTLLSAVLVLVLQLDSFELLARLNADSALRDKVVASAIKSMETGEVDPAAPGKQAKGRAEQCANLHLRPAIQQIAAPAQSPATAPAPVTAAMTVPAPVAAPAAAPKTDAAASPTIETAPPEIGLGGYADCMGLSQATKLGLVTWPESRERWLGNWHNGFLPLLLQIMGLFLSLGLLSLGAPFWYEMLSNLIKLRSTIARKDDAARTERQTTQPAK